LIVETRIVSEEHPSPRSNSTSPHALAHVVEVRTLLLVFVTLIALTAITVGVSCFDFGEWNLIVALSVATAKAALVAIWFMHLRYESPLYTILLFIAIVFLGLFLGITMLDSVQYNPGIQQWQQQHDR
jgi:cytochrome c oxidase subunit IV